jgi:hypothetical protein
LSTTWLRVIRFHLRDNRMSRPRPKKPRGEQAYIPEDGRAVIAYIGMESGAVGSILKNIGMPFVEGDAEAAALFRVKLGTAIDRVTTLEAKVTGSHVKENRLMRRWRAYLAMATARNRIPLAEYRVNTASYKIERGDCSLEELQEAEHQLAQLRSEYYRYKKENDRLRKGKLYLQLASELHRQLRRYGIRM